MKNPRDEFMFSEKDFDVRLTAAHCRAARGWLGWTQEQLHTESGVGLSTIKDYERGRRETHKGVQLLLQNAFAKNGVWCLEAGIYHEAQIQHWQDEPPNE